MIENNKQRIIGLTGGIATGKSAVSHYLEETYHLKVFDADLYAREAVESGSPILINIFERYGASVKLPNGQLNRSALGEIIFNNLGEKQWLENQIHPYVRENFENEIKQSNEPMIVLVIPLLFEVKMMDLVTEIWVVTCGETEQLKRLMTRNGLTKEQAIARINNQLPLAQKMAAADVVLDNSSTLAHLYQQIDQLMLKAT